MRNGHKTLMWECLEELGSGQTGRWLTVRLIGGLTGPLLPGLAEGWRFDWPGRVSAQDVWSQLPLTARMIGTWLGEL